MDPCHLEQFWFTLLHSGDPRELWHPELEIVFLLQGTGRVYFSDLKTAYPLREEDIFVVNSFEVRTLNWTGILQRCPSQWRRSLSVGLRLSF